MDVPPPPPPPPPPLVGGDASAQPMELPPHLQDMMREVQANWGGAQHRSRHARASNDSFHGYQQGHNGYGRGGIYGRGRGRGGSRGGRGGRGGGRFGRGGYGHQQANQQGYGHYKRKRDDEGSGASRFFLPSFLEDPWASLLQPPAATCPKHEEHRQYEGQRAGRVLFQPSFLMDPWAALVR